MDHARRARPPPEHRIRQDDYRRRGSAAALSSRFVPAVPAGGASGRRHPRGPCPDRSCEPEEEEEREREWRLRAAEELGRHQGSGYRLCFAGAAEIRRPGAGFSTVPAYFEPLRRLADGFGEFFVFGAVLVG